MPGPEKRRFAYRSRLTIIHEKALPTHRRRWQLASKTEEYRFYVCSFCGATWEKRLNPNAQAKLTGRWTAEPQEIQERPREESQQQGA